MSSWIQQDGAGSQTVELGGVGRLPPHPNWIWGAVELGVGTPHLCSGVRLGGRGLELTKRLLTEGQDNGAEDSGDTEDELRR